MRKLTKLAMMGIATGITAAAMAIQAYAGQWVSDSTGWRYQDDNGTYPVSSWQWIDRDGDGSAECYYFDQNGYLVSSAEVDGYTLNEDGAWVVDGSVQTRLAGTADAVENTSLNHITINGKDFVFPVSVRDFLASGLSLTGSDYVSSLHSEYYQTVIDGGTIAVLVSNPYGEGTEIPYEDCYVTGLMYMAEECTGEGFYTGNGLSSKTTANELMQIMGTPTNSYEGIDPTVFSVAYEYEMASDYGTDSITYYYGDPETPVVNMISISFAMGSLDYNSSIAAQSAQPDTTTYQSDDNQTIVFHWDTDPMTVEIRGYGEEGEFSQTYDLYWVEEGLRASTNSDGNTGWKDFLFDGDTMQVLTYGSDGIYYGSFQDGEYRKN